MQEEEVVTSTELSSTGKAFIERLRQIAQDPVMRIFATVDGARFGNLPSLLKHANVWSKPLYRQVAGNHAVVVGGPWFLDFSRSNRILPLPENVRSEAPDDDLADISDDALAAHALRLSDKMLSALNEGDPTGGGLLPSDDTGDSGALVNRIERMLQLIEDKPAMVFWICESGVTANAMYRHLRGINQILIPRHEQGYDALLHPLSEQVELLTAGDDMRMINHVSVPKNRQDKYVLNNGPKPPNENELVAADNEEPSVGGHEMVTFRHADANVMMQTIPALDGEQIARLFGPADQILFAPDAIWGGGVKRARKAFSSEHSNGNKLILSTEALNLISQTRSDISRRRISDYLGRTGSVHLKHMDEASREKWIGLNIAEARSFGVRSEADLGRWCYLQAITKGRLTNQPGVVEYMRSGGEITPDEKVRLLLRTLGTAALNDEALS